VRCTVIRWVTKICQAAKYLWGKIVSHFKTVYVLMVYKQDPLEDPDLWEDKLKMDLQEVGWEDMDWIDLAQDRDRWRALVNGVIGLNIRVP